jgi:hypothetical protein
MLYLLWAELALKLSVGLALVFAPLTTIKVLGLPRSETAFYPRILGALLIGVAAATFMEVSVRLGHGLALGGSFVINVAGALVLGSVLAMKQGPTTLRGRLILWGLVALLTLLALAEIAHL